MTEQCNNSVELGLVRMSQMCIAAIQVEVPKDSNGSVTLIRATTLDIVTEIGPDRPGLAIRKYSLSFVPTALLFPL